MFRFNANIGDWEDEINKAIESAMREQEIRLSRIGEMYVIESRTRGSYQDQTENLRNANSYAVFRNGELKQGNFGRPETKALFEKVKTGVGLELIVGNGMNYASFVEGHNFNVYSSGFLLVEREVRKLIK
ncbi:hypothetical protein [Dysgonomonas capnocytophagoides]|uniref:hypothetical protein n=1 Tax=Dysgonomonas capnocytophagoides TaxID=45254 RepID=UPI003342A3B7